MFVIALILFVGGIFAMGISFSLVGIEALVFIGGLLAVSLAIALPIHFGGWARENHQG
ncbi:hypothetical protein [Microbacterium sp.]|jgi:hypothetical protein|uniref:hypothetical protein n=1 Tax=Microbacterium sp. TaxID=51671 RepID=UPI0037C9C059